MISFKSTKSTFTNKVLVLYVPKYKKVEEHQNPCLTTFMCFSELFLRVLLITSYLLKLEFYLVKVINRKKVNARRSLLEPIEQEKYVRAKLKVIIDNNISAPKEKRLQDTINTNMN